MSKKKKETQDTPKNTEINFDYNKHVKEKIINWQERFEKEHHGAKLNYTAIADKMEEVFHIKRSTQKVSAMFDKDSERVGNREVKLQELVALSQLFDIPLRDICEYPTTPSINMDKSPLRQIIA